MKKKTIRLAVALICVLSLASCGQDISKEAAEKGKSYFDSGEYETAAKAFGISIDNGNDSEEVELLYDITLKYHQANNAYEDERYETASDIIKSIDKSYENYGIKENILTLQNNINKILEAEKLLDEISEKIKAQDFVSATLLADSIDISSLSSDQVKQLNKYKTTIASALADPESLTPSTDEPTDPTNPSASQAPASDKAGISQSNTSKPSNQSPSTNIGIAGNSSSSKSQTSKSQNSKSSSQSSKSQSSSISNSQSSGTSKAQSNKSAQQQAAAKAAQEQAAKEQAAKLAQERAAKAAREQAAKEQAAKLAREKAAKEQAAKLAREKAAKEQAAKLAQEQAAKEQAAKEQAANVKPAINTNVANSAYIYPTDSQLLTLEQLKTLSKEDIALIRNEMYARKGHVFVSNKYKTYFAQKEWYKPSKAIAWEDFNATEQANLKLITSYEKNNK